MFTGTNTHPLRDAAYEYVVDVHETEGTLDRTAKRLGLATRTVRRILNRQRVYRGTHDVVELLMLRSELARVATEGR
jgi:hypothetical protein